MTLSELVRAFQEGRFHDRDGPIAPRRAQITRKSLLFFSDRHVMKLRRTRVVDGYDQSALSVRLAMTARERWIARRLSANIYLDECVLRPTGAGDRVFVERGPIALDDADPGEPVVLMRRLGDGDRADERLAGVTAVRAQQLLAPAMLRLAHFHTEAEFHRARPFGDHKRARQRFEATLLRVRPMLEPDEHERLQGETSAMLDAIDATLAHRVVERRIRDVHGELRLEHLFLPTEGGRVSPAFIDPNDGPDSERALDTAEEVMSLALELELLIGVAMASRAVDTYASATRDVSLRRVARFYRRLACLRRAAESLEAAAEPGAVVADEHARVRFFIQHALKT